MGWVKGSEKQLSGPSDKPVFPRVKQLSSHASPCEVRPMFPSVHCSPGCGCAPSTAMTTFFSSCLLPALVGAQAKHKSKLTAAKQPNMFSIKGKTLHYQLHRAEMLQNTTE